MNLGEALRTARKGAHMTLMQASDEISCDITTLCRWERGVYRVPDDALVLAAQVYEAHWLLTYHPVVRAFLDDPGGGAAARVPA